MFISDIMGAHAPIGTYNVGFTNSNHFDGCDETQFFAESAFDLELLWVNFCKENGFAVDCVEYVDLAESDVEIFEEFIERTHSTIFKGVCKWFVAEGAFSPKAFPDWLEMIRYMEEQNELMRG